MSKKVAIIYGRNRYENVTNVLALIKDEIEERVKNKKQIVIKPNLCVPDNELAVTHVEAVKALIDFLFKLNIEDFIIAEGPFKGTLDDSLKNYGYYDQLKPYQIKYVDLNQEKTEKITVKDDKDRNITFNIAKTLLDSDYIISICPPKTHDTVITTLALKNVIVGGIINRLSMFTMNRNWRVGIHGSYKKTNVLIYQLAKVFAPDLCVIDGLKGMEGNGPTSNEPVEFNLALASTDFVAIDSVCSYLMGFNPQEIGYLKFCAESDLGQGDLEKIEIVGMEDLKKYRKKFKTHTTYFEQLKWKSGN